VGCGFAQSYAATGGCISEELTLLGCSSGGGLRIIDRAAGRWGKKAWLAIEGIIGDAGWLKMDSEPVFVGRQAELERFREILKDPKGQAVIVVGNRGMGKTWLVDRMGSIAQRHPDLKCGWMRNEVTSNDTPNSRMALMMDNAFEASSAKAGSFDDVPWIRKQWMALLKLVKLIPGVKLVVKALGEKPEHIFELWKSLERNPRKDPREQFLERLRLISTRMGKNGRAIFVVDPEKYMRKESDQDWAIVVRELPDKIKFIFAQRPDDVLVGSDVMRELNNVVQIPEDKLDELEPEAVNELAHLEVGDCGYTEKELRDGLGRYEGYPYALGAALELIKAGVRMEELPKQPKPVQFAEAQWQKVCEIGDDAMRLFESYAVLGSGVSDDVVEAVSGIGTTARKRLEKNRFLKGLLREEGGGKRIYHAISRDFILDRVTLDERRGYAKRAAAFILGRGDRGFFEKARLLDLVHNPEWACAEIADELHKAFKADEPLACYFYERNDFSEEPSSEWVESLKSAGEFEGLGHIGDGENVSNADWLRAKYLGRVAGDVPEDVFTIISEVEPEDERIQSLLIEAVGNMPNEWAERGYPAIKSWLGTRKSFVWYWGGEASAKLMLRLLDVNTEVAFKIARLLLEVWYDPEGQASVSSSRKIGARFDEDGYGELMLKYYEKVWTLHPCRAATLLVETLAKCLEELRQEGDDEAGDWLNVGENLDEPRRFETSYESTIVQGICLAGKEMIEKQEEKVEDFLDDLRSRKGLIFRRIELHLLRFVPDGVYDERINEIIGDREYFDEGRLDHEYDLLLKEKADIISQEVKNRYVGWINGLKVDDLERFREWYLRTRKREYAEEELEQYESGIRAKRLYAVRDVFPELFAEYKKKSGWTDADLMPLPMVGMASEISGSEGSPKTKEEMLGMSVEDVLEFVSNPENYKEPEDGEHRWHSVASGLAYTLQQVIAERALDYVCAEPEDIMKLGGDFVARYFNGIMNGLSEKDVEGFPWDRFFGLAKRAIDEYRNDDEASRIFQPLTWCVQKSFGEGRNSLKYGEDDIDAVYEIINSLLELKEEKDESYTENPVQIRCNSFTGGAVMISLSLGIICKRDYSEKYVGGFRENIRGLFNRVLDDIRTSWTVCTFGSDLARIYWLDAEWVEDRIEDILSDDLWDTVWKTYLIWSRPSQKVFAFLAEKGIYGKAIGRIGISAKEKDRKDVDKELAKHVVIAYFNGWLEPDEHQIKEQFLDKAPDGLRAHATRFFTTGFKGLKEEEQADEKTVERLKGYWESRLQVIEKAPKDHLQEAMAFAYWTVNSAFGADETFALVGRTLEITGGKLDRNRDVYNFIDSVCDIAEGYEVQAIECMRKVLGNEDVGLHFGLYEEKLTALLTRIVSEDVGSDAVKASIGLIHDLGRLHVYKFRDMLGALQEKSGGGDRTAG